MLCSMDTQFSETTIEYFYILGFAFLCIPVVGEIIYLTYARLKRCLCCGKLPDDNQNEERDEVYERLELRP